jgi:hypothetical protein
MSVLALNSPSSGELNMTAPALLLAANIVHPKGRDLEQSI